jgi:hypothetical protein
MPLAGAFVSARDARAGRPALRDDLTRADALKFCGFIDHLLAILDKAASVS